MTYLPFVDGLRALAIAAVVAFHAFPAAVPGGYVGVDVFFVISGFLITRLISAEMERGEFSFARFFERRARRLLPAALACFAIVTVAAGFILFPDAFLYHGRSLLAAVLMYANIFFYNTGGYFSAPSHEKALLHTWSLAVEDQYYLTWPLLLYFTWKVLPRSAIVPAASIIAVASLAYAEIALRHDSELAFFLLPTRAWELLTGSLLALAAARVRVTGPIANVLGFSGVAAIAASCFVLDAESDFPGLSAVPACLGTAAIIASGLRGEGIAVRLFALKPLVFTGLISYSLYLWHWPLLALAHYRLERPPNAVEASGLVALSLVLAVLSWRYVERPFRKPLGHGRIDDWRAAIDWRFAGGAVAGVLVLVGVAMALKVSKGFPERYSEKARALFEQMVASNPWRRSCDNHWNIFANEAECNFGRRKGQGESYDVAVFGDSMADHWTPLAAGYAERAGLSGRQATNGGCPLLFGVSVPVKPAAKEEECAAYQREASRFLDANPKLKLAIISGYWEKWLARIETSDASNYNFRPKSAQDIRSSAPKFDEVLGKTLTDLKARGIKVLLIGQIPTYDQLPVRCLFSALDSGDDPGRCGVSAAAASDELAASNAALQRAAAAFDNVSLYLPAHDMCGTQSCSPVINGMMLYKNGGHVNRFGAEYLLPFVKFPPLE